MGVNEETCILQNLKVLEKNYIKYIFIPGNNWAFSKIYSRMKFNEGKSLLQIIYLEQKARKFVFGYLFIVDCYYFC